MEALFSSDNFAAFGNNEYILLARLFLQLTFV